MKAKLLKLEPNETVVFRQDLIHKGMGYKEKNERFFVYIDMLDHILQRDPKGTSAVNLTYDQLIKDLDINGLELNNITRSRLTFSTCYKHRMCCQLMSS
jgi:hypothetical protein